MAVSEIKRPLSNSIGSDTVTNTQRGYSGEDRVVKRRDSTIPLLDLLLVRSGLHPGAAVGDEAGAVVARAKGSYIAYRRRMSRPN